MAVLYELLEPVKRKLNITWSDEETDARVEEMMEEGECLLRRKLGAAEAYDLLADPEFVWLFKAWCLYEWNHKANEFAADYAGELEAFRAKMILPEEVSDGES